jgi:branched-chain amino acid transport system substrate-binding protein
MRSNGRRLVATAGVLAVVGGTLVGSAGAAVATPASSKAITTADLREIASYTGSKLGAAKSSLKPVEIGYVNQQGGAVSFPEYTTEVKALVTLLNTKLGGIDGHPIKLDSCYVVSSDQDGQSCGQQFAADRSLHAVLEFPLINGAASFHQVMDPTKVPLFGPIAASVNDATAPYGFYDTAAALTTTPLLVRYVTQKLKVKSVAVVGIQGNALSQLTTASAVQAFNKAKVTAKLALISATSSDATAPLVAAGAQSAGAIVALVADAGQCDSVAQTLKSLGLTSKPVVTLDICSDPAVKAALGDYPTWTYLSGWPSLNAPPIDAREAKEVKVVEDLFKSLGSPTGDTAYTEPSAQGVLTAVREINAAGGATSTPASIVTAAKADKGPMFLGPNTTAWGKIPGLTGVPNLDQRIFTYQGGGKWVDAVGGWYSAPPSAPPTGAPPGGAPPAGAPPA